MKSWNGNFAFLIIRPKCLNIIPDNKSPALRYYLVCCSFKFFGVIVSLLATLVVLHIHLVSLVRINLHNICGVMIIVYDSYKATDVSRSGIGYLIGPTPNGAAYHLYQMRRIKVLTLDKVTVVF